MPTTETTRPTLEETASALRSTLGVLYRKIRQTKTVEDLTFPESTALSRLLSYGPMTSAELAKHEQISAQSVGATVAGLERKGYVQRSADPTDGRRQILALTRTGDQLVRAKRSARTQQLNRALSRLTPEEQAQIHAVLPLLERIAEEL